MARKKTGTPTGKRARKKAAKKAAKKAVAVDAPTSVVPEVAPPEGKKKRVKQVAKREADAATAGQDVRDTDAATAEDPDEPGPVEDLDATLDIDIDTPGAVERLIAETVAGVEAADDEPEPDAEPLDLDGEPVETAASTPAPERAPPASAAAASVARGSTEEDAAVEAPSDLGPVSTPEARDRLLAAALAHAELQDARYRVPWSDPRRAGKWKALTASVLIVLAAAVAAAPPAWVRPESPALLDAAARARSIRSALLLQAHQVEAFRVRWQRLPDTLDELPSRLPGVGFVRAGNRGYQLIAYEADGNAIIYDSADPAPPFEALLFAWIAPEAGS